LVGASPKPPDKVYIRNTSSPELKMGKRKTFTAANKSKLSTNAVIHL